MPLPLEPSACRDRAGGNSRDTGSLVHCSLGVATCRVLRQAAPGRRVTLTGSGLLVRPLQAEHSRTCALPPQAAPPSPPVGAPTPQLWAPHNPTGLEGILDTLAQHSCSWIRHYSHPVRAQCLNKDIPDLQPVKPGAKTLQPLVPTSCQPLCSMLELHQLQSSHHRAGALTESQRLLPFLPSTPSHIPSATPWPGKERSVAQLSLETP